MTSRASTRVAQPSRAKQQGPGGPWGVITLRRNSRDRGNTRAGPRLKGIVNVTFHDGEARRRWSIGFGIVLSVILSIAVFLATALAGLGGRGWQVAFLVQLCFAAIAIVVSMMAAESLAWRLNEEGRVGVMISTVTLALLGFGGFGWWLLGVL